ncbi:MAG: hypothetical protein ACOYVD_14910 [Bacillota bacterium]
MKIKNKIIPVALSLFIGVGSLGIANAAIPVDYQAKMASWIKNDPNPMPMQMDMSSNPIVNTDTSKTKVVNTTNSNTNTNIANNSTGNVGQRNSNIKPSQTNPNINNQLYNQGFQYCTQVEHQQMMQNMTPEQMVEMDKAWHNSMVKQQTQVQHNTMRNKNSTRGWSNNNCGW